MRHTGILRTWHDDRGFGFIAPTQGGRELFVHLSAFGASGGRPVVNERLSYTLGQGADGRPQALEVRREALIGGAAKARVVQRQRQQRAETAAWGTATLFAIPAFAGLFLLAAAVWQVPPWVALGYGVLSLWTYGLYAADKSASQRRGWRVSEQQLHVLGLLGGWPGALLAQQRLRHKSVKPSFRRTFWSTVTLNVVLFVAFSSPWLDAWRGAGQWLRGAAGLWR